METIVLHPKSHETVRDRDVHELRPYTLSNSETARHREVWSIVAMALDRAIGKQGEIPWHLKEDLKHFRELTTGHPVIMGRATWESLPRRPLPGRRNIVLTRRSGYRAEGAEVFPSLTQALAACEGGETPFVIGGGQVYEESLPFCSRVYVTEVTLTVPDADARFPDLPATEWNLTETSGTMTSSTGVEYRFKEYRRR